MLYWYAELNVPSESWSLLIELSLKSKSSIDSTCAPGCENCENVPDSEGRPLPTIFPTDPMIDGKKRTSKTVLTTWRPMNNGHISFFKPDWCRIEKKINKIKQIIKKFSRYILIKNVLIFNLIATKFLTILQKRSHGFIFLTNLWRKTICLLLL